MGLAVGAGIGLAIFGTSGDAWLASAAAVCGASILPDIDEPGSSVSREFGFVSRSFSAGVNKVSGGHRKLTHSLLGLGIVTLPFLLATSERSAGAVVFGLLAASAWRILMPWWMAARKLFLPFGVVAGYLFYAKHPFSGLWLVALVAIGWVIHMLGDFLTSGGIPLLYPKRERESWPIFGNTGSGREKVFAICLLLVTVAVGVLWASHQSFGGSVISPTKIAGQLQRRIGGPPGSIGRVAHIKALK